MFFLNMVDSINLKTFGCKYRIAKIYNIGVIIIDMTSCIIRLLAIWESCQDNEKIIIVMSHIGKTA